MNKKLGLNVGSPKSDTFHHVGGGWGLRVHMCTHKHTGLHARPYTHTHIETALPFDFLQRRKCTCEKKDRKTC